MESRILNAFVAVAEELHFTRAARRLHIAQPALSQQIRQLEQDLKVELFERSKHSVRLTAVGHVFLQHARDMLAREDEARLDAQRAARGEVGRLVIGFAGAAADLVPAAVRRYRARFPAVELVLRVIDSRQQLDGLLQDQMHVGLMHDVVDDARLASELLRRQALIVALPADHALATKQVVELSDLRDETFIMGPAGQGGPVWGNYLRVLLGACTKAGFVPSIRRHASDLPTRLAIVAAGMGVATVLDASPRLERHDVVYRPLGGPPLTVDLFAVWRRDASPATSAFLDALRACARGETAA